MAQLQMGGTVDPGLQQLMTHQMSCGSWLLKLLALPAGCQLAITIASKGIVPADLVLFIESFGKYCVYALVEFLGALLWKVEAGIIGWSKVKTIVETKVFSPFFARFLSLRVIGKSKTDQAIISA